MRITLGLAMTCLFFAQSSFAHPLTDWRLDERAHRWVQPLAELEQSFRLAPRLPKLPELFETVRVDADDLRSELEKISGIKPVVIDGKEFKITERGGKAGRELARRYLEQEYRAAGYDVAMKAYKTGSNFVAELKGSTPDRVLIISSHFDSVGNAGANDDGIGTMSALIMARSLAKLKHKPTLRFVAFDEEELGLVGSKAYVKSLDPQETIIGDVQMEMMGVDSDGDGAFHVIDCARKDSVHLTKTIAQMVGQTGLPITILAACTDRSDHASFWNADKPAVVLSENFFGGDPDPCYHRRCDVIDQRINFAYAANIATVVALAATQWLESE